MENLLNCRRKYSRLLDALNPSNPLDDQLRSELLETISAIDAKLAHVGTHSTKQAAAE